MIQKSKNDSDNFGGKKRVQTGILSTANATSKRMIIPKSRKPTLQTPNMGGAGFNSNRQLAFEEVSDEDFSA